MIDVISAIRAFKFKENEKHITVALSGGADSMALLTGLDMLKDELGIEGMRHFVMRLLLRNNAKSETFPLFVNGLM